MRNRYIRPELWQRTMRWREFYSQLISPGDLVFDIGANHGDRTEIFVEMGAQVVAVEPIQSLAARLGQIFRYSLVKVEAVGVGREFQSLPLHICSTTEMSSFSERFIENQRQGHSEWKWDDVQMVPLVTLDSLICKHGDPAFVKIDVEGFESEVLAGLSRPIKALSFETRPHDSAETTIYCVERLMALGGYEFNLSLEENLAFELPHWRDHNSLLNYLRDLSRSEWRYADIYARRLSV